MNQLSPSQIQIGLIRNNGFSRCEIKSFNCISYTVFPRNLDPFYIVCYCIIWVRTSWTYSTWWYRENRASTWASSAHQTGSKRNILENKNRRSMVQGTKHLNINTNCKQKENSRKKDSDLIKAKPHKTLANYY